MFLVFTCIFSYPKGQVDPNWLLSKGAEMGKIVWIARALALYADRNTTSGNAQERAPVHLAVLNVRNIFSAIKKFKLDNLITFLTGIGDGVAVSSFEWSQNKYQGWCW